MDILERLQAALGERYIVERELGRGGMATVFLARDVKHDRPVAVKVLHEDLAAAIGAQRFQREIHIVGHLTHPNILPLYDSGTVDGSLYYVMPYVQGESLRARLAREHQLPVDDAVRIAREVAEALAHAHRLNILHRDIKPENILLEDGHAVIADFGIARALTDSSPVQLTSAGVSVGTPGYMSPEQASADADLDGRSDQYSLGCVLYEMLAGQPPFTGPNAQAIMARHAIDPVPPLRTVRGTVSESVEDIVMRTLAKARADRFTTCEQLAVALRIAETGAFPRYTASSRGRRWSSPPRRRLGIVALALIPIAAASGGVWVFGRPTSEAAGSLGLDPRRVAVLYFDDRSRGGELADLAGGFTEGLIDELELVRTLHVISKNGVAPYRGTEVVVDSIARALEVGTLIQGSVEPVGQRLRVEVRMLDGNTGAVFRQAGFEKPAKDRLIVRDSLTQQIARFLREKLGEEIRLRTRRHGTSNPDAWVLLTRADRTMREADSLVRADSAGAAQRFRLADSLLAIAESRDSSWIEPVLLRGEVAYRRAKMDPSPQRGLAKMRAALGHAQRALDIDSKSAAALELRGTVRYGFVLYQMEHDPTAVSRLLETGERDLRAAVDAEPSRATAWNTLSDLYIHRSEVFEAKLAARRAYEEDAYLSAAPRIVWLLFSTSYELEDFRDSEHWCQVGLRRWPQNPSFTLCRLFQLTTGAAPTEAQTAWQLAADYRELVPTQARELHGRMAQGLVAIMLARAGLGDSAMHVIERSRGTAQIDPRRILLQYEANVRLLRGERDEALRLLKAYLAINPEIRTGFSRRTSWWWRDLATDPRFKAMVTTGG